MEFQITNFTTNDFVVKSEQVCTCPDFWFPADVRDKLRKLDHGYDGALAHHQDCIKNKEGYLL